MQNSISDLINNKNLQDLSLQMYYESVNNVLYNNLSVEDVGTLLAKINDNGTSNAMSILRKTITDFDDQVYVEFSNLISKKMEETNA